MSGTQEWRPCHICGEKVLWQTNGIGWHRIQYHDCKPVPLARLQQAERERDEARIMVQHNLEAAQRAEAQLAQATALLREARDHVEQVVQENAANWGERLPHKQEPAIECLRMIDAFLAGQPAPAKVAVDDAMVDRAQTAYTDAIVKSLSCNNDTMKEHPMHAALVAALEGRT